MTTDTFDTETPPEALADAGLNWRQWGMLCLVLAAMAFGMTCAFFAGAAWQAETQRMEGRP